MYQAKQAKVYYGSVKEANKKDFDLLCSFRLIKQLLLNNVATVHAEDLSQMYSYSVQENLHCLVWSVL